MAKHFWVHGDNYMAKALIGMRLYKSMIDNLDVGDKEEEMLENAELVFRTYFEHKTWNKIYYDRVHQTLFCSLFVV